MAFFKHELAKLKEVFPYEAADLETDFDSEELEALDNLGVLKGNPHFYLGTFSFEIFSLINIYQ